MLVDDHTSFRLPLAIVLGREPDLEVVAEAGSLAEARALLGREDLEIDVALVDLNLPDGSGVDLIGDLRKARPGTATLVLSAHSDPVQLALAIEAGAMGTAHKSASPLEVVESLRRLHAGEQLLSLQEITKAIRLVSRERQEDHEAQLAIERLTSREREVLQSLAEGLSDQEIAERLYVGVGTVRTHLRSLLLKLHVQSRLQALVFAVRHGLVEIRR
ncbi:response regulator [Rubrobacter marinus]|uniref:Response regulator n=2 Tax=Rubrobacter marinus TaxID=2653852 RepID=A0A6G8Q2V8_9ACTN|nr:response regulator [Rubrobacter marinus]